MHFSLSEDGFEWLFVFEPDSVNLTVKDLFHEKNDELPEKSSGSLELAVVPQTRVFEQPSDRSSKDPQPATDYEDPG